MGDLKNKLTKIVLSEQGLKIDKEHDLVDIVLAAPETQNGFLRGLARPFYQLYDSCVYLNNKSESRQDDDFERFTRNMDGPPKLGGIALWVWKYVSDIVEKWQTPQETYGRRAENGDMKGDCDDIAGLATYLANKNGKPAYFIAAWGTDKDEEESGHAFCYLPGLAQTVGTFKRVNHFVEKIGNLEKMADEDPEKLQGTMEKIVDFWYPTLRGWVVYKQKDDGSGYDRVAGKIYPAVRTIGGQEKLQERKGMMGIEGFVQKLRAIDPEIADVIGDSYAYFNTFQEKVKQF